MATKRKGIVHSVEKSNVMESGLLWREEIQKLYEEKYHHMQLNHMFADNCAMQLVRDPHQFDVIVTTNLFGDLLSDISAQLTGSLGMLPSASLGENNIDGIRKSLYEPVHGSAPDITGQGKANPIAMILSFAMMLRYSLDRNQDAELVEKAVDLVLQEGFRTEDIMQPGKKLVSVNLPWGKLGLSICFDLRFPEIYRNLSKRNLNFISVPSAFTKITGKKHWLDLLKARAIENFCYIFAPNQTGKNTKKRETFGHSVIISPDGKILKIKKHGVGIVYATINPNLSMTLRKIIPSLTTN